jgi:hypothetical protein
MYDTGKVITGIIVFVAVFTVPLWWQAGKAAPTPKPELPKDQKQCAMGVEYMRSSHMQLLNDWRNSVVRDSDRIFVGDNGKKFDMSLSNGCLKCHSDKTKFCDRCHNYMAVTPYCWECHLTPEQMKESK